MRRTYTYDEYSIFRDGFSGGEGSVSKREQLALFEKLVAWRPDEMHIVIRRPDNKVLAFYHPVLAKDLEQLKTFGKEGEDGGRGIVTTAMGGIETTTKPDNSTDGA